jgi:hypothetical protein
MDSKTITNRWILIGGVLIRGFQNNQDINWWNNGKMLIQLGGGEN